MQNQIDLKRLIRFIIDQKNIDANLILDEGCTLDSENQASLVKIINYFLNYLSNLSNRPMEISLDLMGNSFLLNMMAFSDRTEFPELSGNLKDALAEYKAHYETKQEPGSYIQIKITFAK